MADETRVVQAGEWRAALAAARDEGYAFFDWLSAVDRTDEEAAPGVDRTDDGAAPADDGAAPGVDLTAHLLDVSTPGALRGILLVTRVADGEPVDSVTGVYAGAAWHERETHEMFGVEFAGFDDGSGLGIRPLLLPDGFEGTPLRKSFQLAARASKPWPGAKEPGEGHEPAKPAKSPSRRRVQAPGVPPPEWGPR